MRIILEEEPQPIRSTSSIPKEVTEKVISESELPEKLPQLQSSIVEDFIVKKLGDESIKSEDIVQAFFDKDMPQKVLEYQQKLENKSEEINWNNVNELINNTRKNIIQTMKDLGMSESQVQIIRLVEIELSEGMGASTSERTQKEINIEKLQIIRKALDYKDVIGDEGSFQEIVDSIFCNTVGHELGHQIDQTISTESLLSYSSNISYEWGGERTEPKQENPRERFAEYWGRASISDQEIHQRVANNYWALSTASCRNIWGAINSYNSTHVGFEVDINKVWSGIRQQVSTSSPEDIAVSSLCSARAGLYGRNNAPENFAVPYLTETVETVIRE